MLWVLRSGARWSDLPERYGKYKSVHKRFVRWARAGVWDRVFGELVQDKKNQYRMIDSTIVRAHQQAATGCKKVARTRLWAFPRRSHIKIHLLADELGMPLDFRVTAAQIADCFQAIDLLGQHKAEAVTADKGYDGQLLLQHREQSTHWSSVCFELSWSLA